MDSQTTLSDDYAVVVGIDWYPNLSTLGGPRLDAEAFAAWLLDRAGGGLDPARMWTIMSPAPATGSARPLVAEVHAAFDEIDDIARENDSNGRGLKVGRRLYLYFSGHGFSPDNDETALLMANATKQRIYHLPGRAYANWFFNSGYFKEVVLFMDCCREEYKDVAMNQPHFKPLLDRKSEVKRLYGYATRWSRLARERKMGDGVTRGVFTTALLTGLKGAAANTAGFVTAASLRSYLFENMKTFLAPADLAVPTIPKEPDVLQDPNNGDGFVLATVTPPRATVTVRVAAPDAVQLIGPNMQAVVAVTAGPPAWSYEVVPGLYLIQKVAVGGMVLDQQPVNLAQGGNPDVVI